MPGSKFSVTEHGFKFQGKPEYWLNGGICLAALKNMRSARPVPLQTAMEDLPSEVWYELEEFQYKTILNAMRDVIQWMDKSDDQLMTAAGDEYVKLSERLQQNDPVLVCLIREPPGGEPMNNHFIVVYDLHLDGNTAVAKIYDPVTAVAKIYDPVYPQQENVTMRVELTVNNNVASLHNQSTGEIIRGFFVIDFERYQRGI
jgi:hypothetical protein